jgi:hypothetical protein
MTAARRLAMLAAEVAGYFRFGSIPGVTGYSHSAAIRSSR